MNNFRIMMQLVCCISIFFLILIYCNENSPEDILNGGFLDHDSPIMNDPISESDTLVNITFNKSIHKDTAELINNYTISWENGDLQVISAKLTSTNVIKLTTSKQIPSIKYTLVVKNLKGLGLNPIPKEGYSKTFLGYGTSSPSDFDAPSIISPKDGEQTYFDVTFVWENKTFANEYKLIIATDSDFSNVVVDKSLKVNTYEYVVSDSITHYWKVYTDISKGEIPIQAFEPLDAIYVWGDSPSTDTPKGTKNKPFKNIQEAINTAYKFEKDVKIAKVNNEYTESIILFDGISVYGGYSNSDNWAIQDYETNVTKIRSQSSAGVTIIGIKNETILEGFTIYGDTTGSTYAIYTSSSTSKMVIRNCNIFGGACLGECYGIYNTSKGDVTIENCKILGGYSTKTGNTGIYNSSSSPIIKNNPLIIGGDCDLDTSYGISNINSSNPTISGNIIWGSQSGEKMTYGIYNIDSSPILDNNTITGGNSGIQQRYGIYTSSATTEYNSEPTITNNVINSGPSPTSQVYAIYSNYINKEIIENNKIYIKGNNNKSGTGYYLQYGNSDGKKIFKNNVMILDESDDVSYGIYIMGGTNITIENNYINSGKSINGASMAIRAQLISSTTPNYMYIKNNVLTTGTTGLYSFGIDLTCMNDNTAIIANNTIITNDSKTDSGRNAGICYHSCQLNVVNNIIVSTGIGYNIYNIWEYSSTDDITEIKNNLMFHVDLPSGTTFFYRDNDDTNINDSSAQEEIDVKLQTLGESNNPVISGTISGNITYPIGSKVTSLTDIFVDPNGTITPDDPWDNFKLKARNRAIDKGSNIYNNSTYDSITTDIIGNPRPSTGVWEIGAYEY